MAEIAGHSSDDRVAVVLAGGGARGAYEVGALSVLLPVLTEHGMRPTVFLGTSVGALNAAYLAANADESDVTKVIQDGIRTWQNLGPHDLQLPLLSSSTVRTIIPYVAQAVGFPRPRVWSLLDTSPLSRTIKNVVDFDRLASNVGTPALNAVGVVASSALTRRAVVFHDGGQQPSADRKRLVDYVATTLKEEHVQASAAIPAAFPAVQVTTPSQAAGWYTDGGTSLNVPIKPALELGATRVVVIGLSSLSAGPTQIASRERPDAFAGLGRLVQGLVASRLVQDIRTLATINEDVKAGHRPGKLCIPYIAITPEDPDEVESLAREVFVSRYKRLTTPGKFRDVTILGRLTDASADSANATTLSLLLFVPEFIDALIELGANDARRWINQAHEPGDPLWQVDLIT